MIQVLTVVTLNKTIADVSVERTAFVFKRHGPLRSEILLSTNPFSLVFKVHITEVLKFLSSLVSTKYAFLFHFCMALGTPFLSAECAKLFPLLPALFTCLKCIFFCNCIYSVPICLSPCCLKLSLLMHPQAICCFLSLLSHKPLWTKLPHLFPLIYYSNLKSPEEPFISPSLHPNLCTHLSSTTPSLLHTKSHF